MESGQQPARPDLEEIVRIVVHTMAAKERAAAPPDNPWKRWADHVKTSWPLAAAVASVALAAVTWVTFGISPLDAAQQLSLQRKVSDTHVGLANDFLSVGQSSRHEPNSRPR